MGFETNLSSYIESKVVWAHSYRTAKAFFVSQRMLEVSASVVTLTGQALGSTSFHGAVCYACSTMIWIWLTIYTRMWGLIPLNFASLLISTWTLWQYI